MKLVHQAWSLQPEGRLATYATASHGVRPIILSKLGAHGVYIPKSAIQYETHTNITPAKKEKGEKLPGPPPFVSRIQVIEESPYSHTVLRYFSHLAVQMGKTRRLTEYITDPEWQPSAKGCTESCEHVV